MHLVVVTGMSGSGKITALKMLEDVGYYCVDNLPIQLIENLVDRAMVKGSELSKVALGLDARADEPFEVAVKILDEIKKRDVVLDILFLETSDAVLMKRYKESRRMHPLAPNGRVDDGISKEREVLKEIKERATYIIDTSNLLTRELKEEIDSIFVEGKEYNNLMVNIVSFGFKNGILPDADLVFDVRFLPNPYYIDELKELTGLDKPVQEFVMGHAEAGEFLERLESMLDFLIPNYVKEGKYQLVVAIGCTGGHHRSVTIAEELFKRIHKGTYGLTLSHRDVNVHKQR